MASSRRARAGASGGGAGGVARLGRVGVGAAMIAALALAAPALGASRPAASTGGARQVSYGSATVTGSVNPNGSDTSFYFQYGPTKAYGGQTAIADAGAGTHRVSVALALAGLQPLTLYHYRLVAVSGAGVAIGADAKFLTTKVPLTLAILVSPNPVLFADPAIVQGTLSGTGNENREVVLQAVTLPANAGFVNVGNPELTSLSGGFSFPVLGLAQVTEFRVLTTTNPPVVSPVVVENVAVRVDTHVGRTRRPHFARIYGTVTPAVDGMQVAILRITHGRGVLVAGTTLHHRDASSSKFSRVVRVKRGVYRVLVRVINGAQVSNYSEPLLIR